MKFSFIEVIDRVHMYVDQKQNFHLGHLKFFEYKMFYFELISKNDYEYLYYKC
jgi:hypothetical protein